MKTSKSTGRERAMIAILLALILGAGYYSGFYAPLQEELTAIAVQSGEIDSRIAAAMTKAEEMDRMQAELEEILSRPRGELTEIAPYDNKEAVLSHLYGVLGQTLDYSLSFTDPEVREDGTVRRNISLTFRCADYAAAKAVLGDLTASRWRCLVRSLVITGNTGNILEQGVTVTATITFFEHTDL